MQVGLCTWQLTYYSPAAEAMGAAGVVQGLVELVRSAVKEKVGIFCSAARMPSNAVPCSIQGRLAAYIGP